jgi:protein-tyrosine phosphatase
VTLGKVTRICFVCTGNIVRSPLAENLFRHLSEEAGAAHHYEVDSAGTGPWHVGQPPDARMLRVAARHGFRYDHRGRQFHNRDFDRFDLIVAMDAENRDELLYQVRFPEQEGKIRMMREFDPDGGPRQSVPDPYYEGRDGFEEVYQVIERSVKGLLSALEEGRVFS